MNDLNTIAAKLTQAFDSHDPAGRWTALFRGSDHAAARGAAALRAARLTGQVRGRVV